MKSFLVVFCVFISSQVMGSTAEDCKPKVDKARSTLLELMGGKVSEEQQKAVKDSANVAHTCIMEIKAPGHEAKVAELQKVWSEFKATRENELVPLILAGKKEEAKKIGGGIQSERIGKVKSIIQQLSE